MCYRGLLPLLKQTTEKVNISDWFYSTDFLQFIDFGHSLEWHFNCRMLCLIEWRHSIRIFETDMYIKFRHDKRKREWHGFTLSQTSPGFYVSALKVFWKHCEEKEKLLVTSNFSFSHIEPHSFEELSAIFVKFKIVVCVL